MEVKHVAAMATAHVVDVHIGVWADKWNDRFVDTVSMTFRHARYTVLPPTEPMPYGQLDSDPVLPN